MGERENEDSDGRIIARMTLTPQDRVYLAHSEVVTVDITEHPELVRLRARVEAVEAERDRYKALHAPHVAHVEAERDEARRERDRLRDVVLTVIDASEDTDDRSSTDKYEEAMQQIADACYEVAKVSEWKREHIAAMEAADVARGEVADG